MRIIEVTLYWKSEKSPACYHFDTLYECLLWTVNCLHYFVKETMLIKYEVIDYEEN